MNKNKIADAVLIGSGLILLIWALLKSFGVIHSPVWSEMIPYFAGGTSILGIVYKWGAFNKDFEILKNKVERLIKLEERFNKVENEHNLCMQGKLSVH